ncbi:MAG: TCR/Tet family MFS transporter [Alphaproteobacteria bacterium]|nr:TCR/Tet family MFS transporter [Alphaproteobacteria bacterium]
MPDQPNHNRTLAFVCLVIFLDALAVGLILPVTPQLIAELTSLPNSRAAEMSGYLMFAFAGTQFFCAPILGGLSDRYGRRPVLLLALFGFALNYLLMALAPTLIWLFVARVISGACGATFPTANASIVDVTAPADRARVFGLTGAALGVGFIFGPAIGGAFGEFGARLPFWIAGIFTFAVFVYGYATFKETLTPGRRRDFDPARANPLGSVRSVARYPVVFALLIANFFFQLSSQSYSTIWAFFTIEVAGWTPWEIGLSAGAYGLMVVAMQGFLTGPVIKRFGEWRALWFGLTMALISYLGFSVANGPLMIYAFIVVGGMAGFLFPAMQSLMTKGIPENAQGELQGALASSFSLSAIIGPIVMTHIFSAFTGGTTPHFPGAPFLAGALLIICAAIVLRGWGQPRISERTG